MMSKEQIANKMDCSKFEKHIPDYIEQGKDYRDSKNMDEHSATCISCSTLYNKSVKAWSLIGKASINKVSEDFYYKVRNRAEQKERMNSGVLSPVIVILRPVLAVATIAIAVLTGIEIGNSAGLFSDDSVVLQETSTDPIEQIATDYHLIDDGHDSYENYYLNNH